MKRYFGLLNAVAQEYNIQKGLQETESSWQARVIYSLLGQTGYASLFDVQEDLRPSSIVHFKSRIEDVLKSLLNMYPEMAVMFSGDHCNLSTEIYNVLTAAGYIYHEPNRITVPICREAKVNNCTFLRGHAIGGKRWMSGIGCFLLTEKADIPASSLSDMFQLQAEPLKDAWQHIISGIKWEKASEDLKLQYIRTEPFFKNGYWVDSPDNSGATALSRTGFAGNYLYYLYKVEKNSRMISQIPSWMTEGYSYRNFSVACLADRGTLPPTTYHVDGKIVSIRIGYLFPPAELNLIKLYSWPTTYIDLPHDFNRLMSIDVFEDIKEVLETIGYKFKEE